MTRTRRWIPVALASGSLLFLTVATARADYREGVAAFQKKDYATAAQIFEQEVESAPNYSFGWYMLGMISLAQEDFAKAKTQFDKAIELDPNKFPYYQGLAKLNADQNDYQKAVEILEERRGLAESDRDRLILNYTLGLYYAKLDNHAEAVDHLEKAKAISPSQSITTQLGISYYSLGDYDKAIDNLKVAVEKDRENQDLMFFLGSSHLNKAQRTEDETVKIKQYDEAVRLGRQLVLMDPKNFQYHNLLARSLFGAKRFSDALRSFNEVLSLKPDYCYAYTNIGKVYIANGQIPEAESTLRKGIACDDSNHLTYEALGTVLENEKKYDESLKAFQDAQERRPTKVSLEGVTRLQAKIQNQEIDAEQAAKDKAVEEEYRRKQAEYEKYQQNLKKFDQEYGNKGDQDKDKDKDKKDDSGSDDSGGDGGGEDSGGN